MKKAVCRVLLAVLALCGLAGIGFRIWYVNATAFTPESQTFAQGDWVELDGAFQDASTENTDGYSVRVVSAKYVPYEEFVARYGETIEYLQEEMRPQHVVDVEIEVKNTDNTEGFINMSSYYLQTETDSYIPNPDLWNLANPSCDGRLGFQLLPDSQMTFHIPYKPLLARERKEPDYLLGSSFQLVVSQIPVKKMIPLTLDIDFLG